MKPGDHIQVVLRNQVVEAQIERRVSPELFVVQTAGIYKLTAEGQATHRFVAMVQPTAWVIGDAAEATH